MKAVVNEQKKAEVKEVGALLEEYPIIGVVDMESLPGKNLAQMRKRLRGTGSLLMRKKRLIKLALKDCKKQDILQLEEHMKGMPALLFTKENPFTLFKTLKKNQSSAPIKAGQEAPIDLVVPAGTTEFTPGPMIGELGQMGIKTAVENGKIAIKEDATIAKEGDVIDEKQAGFLAKMGVEPMRIGLRLVAVWEEGKILTAKVLNIDEDAFMADLQQAAGMARTLSLELAIPTKDTIEQLLQKAHLGAQGLAREANIMTSDNVGEILAAAAVAGDAIKALVPDAPVEKAPEVAEEKTEEKPAEAPEEKAEAEKSEAPAEKIEEKPAEAAAEKAEVKEAPDTPVETAEEQVAEQAEEAPAEKPAENQDQSEKEKNDPPAKPDDDQKTEA